MWITPDEVGDEITDWHPEFDGHTLIDAEGAPTQRFVDIACRQMFDNAAECAGRYPTARRQLARWVAPRVEDGYELNAVR